MTDQHSAAAHDQDVPVLAHDLGTTGDKATLVTASGRIVGSTTVAYPVDFGTGRSRRAAP